MIQRTALFKMQVYKKLRNVFETQKTKSAVRIPPLIYLREKRKLEEK